MRNDAAAQEIMAQTLAPSASVVREILEERVRHVLDERWTLQHDDEHSKGEMALAAGVYAIASWKLAIVDLWPWSKSWLKLSNPRRNLVKAGALIVAEIERLDRISSDISRVSEIDKMFDEATGWGSWMVECANEREALATKHGLPQKHQARTSTGGRTS